MRKFSDRKYFMTSELRITLANFIDFGIIEEALPYTFTDYGRKQRHLASSLCCNAVVGKCQMTSST